MKKIQLVIIGLMLVMVGTHGVKAEDGPSAEAQKLVESMWAEAKSSLELLQVPDVASLKEKYIKSAKNVMKRFDALPADKKEALSKAPKPLAAIKSLQINKGLKGSQKIFPPSITNYLPNKPLAALSPEQVAEIQKFLTGTWNRNWVSAKETYKWQISPDGKVVQNSTRRGKAEEPKNLILSFEKENQMKVKKGNSSQTYVFLRYGKNFYTSSNTLYNFHKISDKNKFTVKHERDVVIYDNGKCTVVSEKGLVAQAKAAFETVEGKETFKFSYQFEGDVNHLGKPKIHEKKMYVMGDFLVHEALVESGTWTR